jgi:hypothetical protein
VRLSGLPGHGTPAGAPDPLAGPFTFGVAVPPPS